jgi:hypothetical protein
VKRAEARSGAGYRDAAKLIAPLLTQAFTVFDLTAKTGKEFFYAVGG